MVALPPLPAGEDFALRRELALRILLQNALLIVSVILFALFAAIALLRPDIAWAAAAGQGVVSLALALQWCHHGIRTRQIKLYLVAHDQGQEGGWERWLPANRPQSFLGARWMISTKGVFLGLQLAMIATALSVGPALDMILFGGAAALVLANAGFLLTNPKE